MINTGMYLNRIFIQKMNGSHDIHIPGFKNISEKEYRINYSILL